MHAQRDVATLTQDATIKGTTKSGGTYTYKGITSAQIVTRAKEALTKHGVLFWPQADKEHVNVNGNQTAIYVVGRFINVDRGDDWLEFGAWGSDTDNSGKGYMKALTNATKQVLAKALMMSTVEDESEKEVEHEAAPRSAAMKEADAAVDVSVKSWADALKKAIDGAQSADDLAEVHANAAPMLKSSKVPEVTRGYFTSLFKARFEAMAEGA